MAPFAQPFYPGESRASIVGVKLDVLRLNSFLYSANIAQLDKVGAQGRPVVVGIFVRGVIELHPVLVCAVMHKI
jgi:hypothetical protein